MISRRGIFRLLAAAGVGSFLKPPLAAAVATEFPQEGYERARVKWFNRVRGFGYLIGQSSGQTIFINKRVFEAAGIEKVRLTTWYGVYWKNKSKGPIAQEIRESRPWTREEAEQQMHAWFEEQDRRSL